METHSAISLTQSKTLSIIYHFPCFDGAYGAINTYWYYSHFSKTRYIIKLFPIKNNWSKVPAMSNVDKIILIDLGVELDIDFDFILNHPNIPWTIIDHHESWYTTYTSKYKDKLDKRGKFKWIFNSDSTESACGWSFRHYKQKALNKPNHSKENVELYFSDELRKVEEYIEDSDTAAYRLPSSQEFKSGICHQLHPINSVCDWSYKTESRLSNLMNINARFTAQCGEKEYRKYKKKAINEILHRRIYRMELTKDWNIIVCVTENKQYRNYASPVLGRVSKYLGYWSVGGFIYADEKGLFKVSMRTGRKDEEDLVPLAQLFGGGGHKNAASFLMPWMKISTMWTLIDVYKEICSFQN